MEEDGKRISVPVPFISGAQAESSNLLLTIGVTSGLFPANNLFYIAQGHSVTVTEGNRSWQLLWSHDPRL